MDIYCPHCGTRYEVSDEECGRKALCEVCNNKFIIAASQSAIATANHTSSQENADTRKVPRPAFGKRAAVSVIRLDYARNCEYFSVPNEAMKTEALHGCITVVVGPALSLVLAVAVGNLLVFVIGFVITAVIFKLVCAEKHSRPSDAEVDMQAKAMGQYIESIALRKLGVDREEVSLTNPVHFWGYRFVWPSVLGDNADNNAHWVIGKDGRCRTAEVTHTIFFFGEHSVYCYERTLSLVCSSAMRDSTEEYFYRDIVSVKTDSKNVPWRNEMGVEVKDKSFRTDVFVIANSGGERRECEVMNPVEAEEIAKAFRMLLRQKKL